MCSPLAVAAVAVQGAGMVMQNSAEKKAAKAQQSAMNRQVGLAAEEFDRRTGYANLSDDRTGDYLDQGFKARGDNASQTFDALSTADTAANDRNYDAGLGDVFKRAGIFNTAQRENADASAEYDTVVAAERARQAGFRDTADNLVNTGIGNSGMPAFTQAQDTAIGDRTALMDQTRTPQSIADVFANQSPAVQEALARKQSEVSGTLATEGAAGAKIAAAGDALTSGNRTAETLGENLDTLNMQSENSLAALPSAVAPAAYGRRNAMATANDQAALQSSETGNRLKLSEMQRLRDTVPLQQAASAVDEALKNFYDRNLQSEANYSANMIGSSTNYEDANRDATNYKIANTRAYNPIGQAFSAAGNALASYSASNPGQGPGWSDVGGWFKSAPATPMTTGPGLGALY